MKVSVPVVTRGLRGGNGERGCWVWNERDQRGRVREYAKWCKTKKLEVLKTKSKN